MSVSRALKPLRILVLTSAISCVASPAQPTPLPPLPLVLTGQSQAVILGPHLARAYHGPVTTVAESGLSIAFWSAEDRLWRQLIPSLHQPLAALVFWQGESDCAGTSTAVPDYAARFGDLMSRIRREADAPSLPVLVVTVTPLAACANVRQIQAEWTREDAHATLVAADEIPRVDFPADIHITDAGAEVLAHRLVAAVTTIGDR